MEPRIPEPTAGAIRLPRPRTSQRVATILSERIRSGLYGAGKQLPTERALSEDLGVHRRAVRAAIEQLVHEGLVTRRPNCRPTVREEASQDVRGNRERPSRISASNLIALIMWHGGGPLECAGTSQQRIFWGMNRMLMQAGYHAVFLDLGDRPGSEEENAAREAEHLRYIRDQGFGGALFYPYAYRLNRDLAKEVARSVPLVLLDRKILGLDADFVGVDSHGASMELTRHLIRRGHRRIAHVTRYEPIRTVRDRIQGYLDAMRDAAAAAAGVEEMVLHVPPYADDHAWTAVDAVFRLPEERRPTAAACVNDYTAVKLAARLERLGLSVPGDVALTGFDDIVPALPNGAGLTTAAQPYEEIGSRAVDLLMRRIADPSSPTISVELPARLVIRSSSVP